MSSSLENQIDNIVIDDAVLVRKCQEGDSAAMQRLIVKYQDRVYNVILKICSNKDDAAELTQETFVKFIEKISSFKMQSSFYTWLFRIAVNLSLNFCRRRFKVKMHSIDAPSGPEGENAIRQLREFFSVDQDADPVAAAQNREIGQIISSALGKLEDKQRVAVVLRDIEGMAYAEIAESLDLEIGTVKSRISRGRESLREILKTVLKA